MTANAPKENHCITSNEGTAVALASGYHLSTGKSAMVYLQVIKINLIYNFITHFIIAY